MARPRIAVTRVFVATNNVKWNWLKAFTLAPPRIEESSTPRG
jgi:hypothetical protein